MFFANGKYDYFIMVGPGSDYGDQMWKDLSKLDNCFYSNNVLKATNSFVKLLHHIHFSFAINKILPLPFKSIWNNKYFLSTVDFNQNKRFCVILTDVSACRIGVKYLKKISRKPNVDLVLVNVNVFQSKKTLLAKRLCFFNKVFTFDKRDADEYGFILYEKFYSSEAFTPPTNNAFLYDAVFVGRSKGRAKLLSEIADKMVANGLKPCFYVVGVKKKEQFSKNVIYNKKIDYDRVLALSKLSKCIVEVVANNQEGFTLRFVEAVCLNKLLMTNNQNVVKDPFYKSGNIKVFSNANDFDVSFIRNKIVSSYNYNNEFSPIHFVEELCKQ